MSNTMTPRYKEIKVIAIGASTGGPIILETILSSLPHDFPPILIVQHMAVGFIQQFVHLLTEKTHQPIIIPTQGMSLSRGQVYFAPDSHQMGTQYNHKIFLEKNVSNQGICPSIDYLFTSVTSTYQSNALGILLTGMGDDGAKGLKQMRDAGAITIVQNEESSLINGMPGNAVILDAATFILNPSEIAVAISVLSTQKNEITYEYSSG